MRAVPPLPVCPRCGAVARPNILMFGDGAWVPGVHAQRMAEHRAWLRSRDATRVAVVELGAGTAVPTVRRHAELAAASSGRLVRVNVREPEVRHGHGVGLAAGARATLEALDALLADASEESPYRRAPFARRWTSGNRRSRHADPGQPQPPRRRDPRRLLVQTRPRARPRTPSP